LGAWLEKVGAWLSKIGHLVPDICQSRVINRQQSVAVVARRAGFSDRFAIYLTGGAL
jgi:hypothetical protein